MTQLRKISAVTLATRDMTRAVAFYEALGFPLRQGGRSADFITFDVGDDALNLIAVDPATPLAWWGRVIFHVGDVDAFHAAALRAGLEPDFPPRDAAWGERYFHITDPDGHEISIAAPLD